MWAAKPSGPLEHITSQEFWLHVNAPLALVQRSPQRLAHLGKAECLPPSLGQVRLEPIIAREEFSPQGGALSLQIERRFPCVFSAHKFTQDREPSTSQPEGDRGERAGRVGGESRENKNREKHH